MSFLFLKKPLFLMLYGWMLIWPGRAALTTVSPAGGTTTVFPGGNTCEDGPTSSTVAGFMITTTGDSCYNYDSWSFDYPNPAGNGYWDWGVVGENSGTTAITFDLGRLVSAVGGFMNYVPLPDFGAPPTISVLGADGGVLESYDLSVNAPISTPNQHDAGAFRGITRSQGDIRYFRISGSFIAMHDITLSVGCPVNVRFATGGGRQMQAFFTAPSGTLAAYANACGFKGFDWQQTITNFPCPSHLFANNPSALPVENFCPGTTSLTATAAFPLSDPPSGGYTSQHGPYANPFPFYYPSSLAISEENSPTNACVFHRLDGSCLVPLVSADGRTLGFSDTPSDPCLPGGSPVIQALFCGGGSAPAGSVLSFTTSLVGISQSGQPSTPLFQWTWNDTFNGTSGAQATTQNDLPVDDNSGTGGITITGIGGVTLPPAVATDVIEATASGLVYSRVNQTFNGTVILSNISPNPVSGPFQILLVGLPSGVTLANASGSLSGMPFVNVPGFNILGTGQFATVVTQFKNPANVPISFTPIVYAGSLN